MKSLYTIIALLVVAAPLTAQNPLTLEACKQMARENNLSLKHKRLEKQVATQTAKEAFTAYFPSVEASGMYANLNEPLVTMPSVNPLTGVPFEMSLLKNGKTASVTATQPVFAGGRIVNSNKLARMGKEIVSLQYEREEDEVERTTERMFWQVVRLEEKLKTIATLEEQMREVRKDVELAVRAGVSTRNDLLRVEMQELELESNRLKIENGIGVSKLLLGQHIGIDGKELRIDYEELSVPESPLTHYMDAREAVLTRPESALLDRSVRVEELQRRIEVGKRLPSVGVGAGYVYNDFMGNAQNFGMMFAIVKVPVSDWWGGSHAIRKQALKHRQAEIDRDNGMEMMLIQTEQTWNELQEAYKQVLVSERSVASSTENMRVHREGYRAGTLTLSDVLDAQSLLQQARDRRTEALTGYRLKLTEYLQFTGK